MPFRESNAFFEAIPGVLGRSVNFNITERFLLRRPAFPDYLFLMTMLQIWNKFGTTERKDLDGGLFKYYSLLC